MELTNIDIDQQSNGVIWTDIGEGVIGRRYLGRWHFWSNGGLADGTISTTKMTIGRPLYCFEVRRLANKT